MNGADGQGGSSGVAAVLLAQTQGDAPLEACANGGVIVGFGVDTNTNGELDEDEVTRREAICFGVDGAPGESCAIADNADGSYTVTCPDSEPVTIRDGAPGQSVAVRQSAEPAGANCEAGGTKIEMGSDDYD